MECDVLEAVIARDDLRIDLLDILGLDVTIGHGLIFAGNVKMLERAIRAAFLDRRAYQGITDDPRTTFSALGIVAVAAVAFGLGMRNRPIEGSEATPTEVMLVAISTVMVGWVAWAFVCNVFGTRVLGGNANNRILLRALGIAHGPSLLFLLISLPVIGDPALILARVWLLVAGVVAVREAQGFGWLQSILPTVTGWIVAIIILPGAMLPAPVEDATAASLDSLPILIEQGLHVVASIGFNFLNWPAL